jgi:predicted dehydrogenase
MSDSSGITRRNFTLGALAALGAAASHSLVGCDQGSACAKNSRTVKIGIVGGRFGLEFDWNAHPSAEVVAVCDRDPGALAFMAEYFGAKSKFTDFDEMLGLQGLEAVGVFTPPDFHVPMSIAALKRGLHVLCAVPAGMSVEELSSLQAAVKRHEKVYMLAETSFYRMPVQWCREKAAKGGFGHIFYSEAEYLHPNLLPILFDAKGKPTWRHGFPPIMYPTHATGIIVPVTGTRLTHVSATGWGDDHEILRNNRYSNPFWNETAVFKTSSKALAKVSVWLNGAFHHAERGDIYGTHGTFLMARPGSKGDVWLEIPQDKPRDRSCPSCESREEIISDYDFLSRLPPSLQADSPHGGSHPFIVHEFIQSILEQRAAAIGVTEAINYTLPGIIAHQSALRGGEWLEIPELI